MGREDYLEQSGGADSTSNWGDGRYDRSSDNLRNFHDNRRRRGNCCFLNVCVCVCVWVGVGVGVCMRGSAG